LGKKKRVTGGGTRKLVENGQKGNGGDKTKAALFERRLKPIKPQRGWKGGGCCIKKVTTVPQNDPGTVQQFVPKLQRDR